MMMIYISGALKGSRDLDKARRLYELAAEAVFAAGHSAYLPHQHTDPEMSPSYSAESVFKRDIDALRRADAVIVFLREPSLGVGAEIALCAEARIPMLGLCEIDDDVSRFVVGLIEDCGSVIIKYAGTAELAKIIISFLSTCNFTPEKGSPTLEWRAPRLIRKSQAA